MNRRAMQIYLSPEQHLALEQAARCSGRAMTHVVRDLIDQHLRGDGPPPTDLSHLIGSVSLGHPTSVATEKDEWLMDAPGRDLRRH